VNKLAVIVLLAGLAACSRKKPEEGREPAQTSVPGAVVGNAAPSAPVPAAGNAGSTAPAAGNAGSAAPAAGNAGSAAGSPANAPGVGCATASSLVCGAGQSDGCTSGLTSVHVCVAEGAKAGPPCAQETALACPPGQADACLHAPPLATNHVCVIAPKPTP
jgi:hypothetical protein